MWNYPILTFSLTNVITNLTGAGTFSVIDTKLYVLAVTISANENAKLLQQLKSGFTGTINWNKYQSNVSIERQNWYVDYLIYPSFQEVNRHFV